MAKSLSALYFDAYASVARRQHEKYGNPTAEQSPAPAHVPAVLQRAVNEGILIEGLARKLAQELGHKAYGEVGLSDGICTRAIESVCGFDALPWYVKGQLAMALAVG